ncbi:MAG TPA: 3-hydroxyacyl-CoA dehydrogenase NAD-binding domain-containing protein [Candidatus Dormibacteraeota bacterium]|nr:3-hydroxyacyl-CoA dehydrogenase NAD-binding domain-containing protein [Candidatus Dormibacteraeota bacterium]
MVRGNRSERSAILSPEKRLEVRAIAVIGAGTVGREIALAALCGGYRTILEDVSPEVLENARQWIEQCLQPGLQPNFPEMEQFSTASNVNDGIREADLIIDAVADELEMKLELFTIFDKFAKPGAIFASATSAESIGDFSDVTLYRERCVGLRFLRDSGTQQMKIVRTSLTSDETVQACEEVARRMGLEIVS